MPHYKIPSAIFHDPKLTPTEKLLMGLLLKSGGKKRQTPVTNGDLALLMHCSRRSVTAALGTLEEAGCIRRVDTQGGREIHIEIPA